MAGGTIRVAQPCGCAQESFMGQKRDKLCACGNLFEKPAVADARREKNRQRAATSSAPRPIASASPAQRAKVKGGPCVGCGRVVEPEEQSGWTIDPAHVWPQGKGGCDHPDCVLPACRYIPTGEGCHRLFDNGELDLLSKLSEHPEAFAIEVSHPIRYHGVTLPELAQRLAGNAEKLVWLPQERTVA